VSVGSSNQTFDSRVAFTRFFEEAFFQMEEPLRDCSDWAEIVATLLRSGRLNPCHDVILELEEKLLALRASLLKESEIHAE
jgi:hypothetical protein